MKDDRRGGNFMDFYNRQKSPIYDGRGNVTGYNHGYGERETFDKPVPRDQYTGPGHEMGESRRPRKEIVNRPTRDLKRFDHQWDNRDKRRRDPGAYSIDRGPRKPYDRRRRRRPRPDEVGIGDFMRRQISEKEPTYGRWQDQKLPGEIDLGTWEPQQDLNYEYRQTAKERDRGRRRLPSRYTPYKNERSHLSTDEDRLAMLTGRSDPPEKPWQSQYGGREEYDPQDREFNRQFDERPRGRQPWDSDPTGNPLERDPLLKRFGDTGSTRNTPLENIPTRRDQREHTLSDYERGGDIEREYDEWREIKGNVPPRNETSPRQYWEGGKKWETQPAQSWDYGDDLKGSIPEGRTDITPPYDDTELRKRLAALEERGPIVTQPTQDLSGIRQRIKELEGRPQSTGGNWNEDRIKALEGRPQGGGWQEDRVSQLEKKPWWQEERVSAIESRKPSWQEDRIAQLEGRQDDTSWKNPLSQVQTTQAGYGTQLGNLQTGQTEGKTARSGLDTRLGALENYYKNDPPPEESVGNRYEDKMANLNKMWEQQGSTWDNVKDTKRYQQDSSDERKWSQWGQNTWTTNLPDPYVNQLRDLNREYNKPTSTAIIKGREYKSYGPRADARLKDLDKWNIHEDEYLGTDTWKDQYGEDVHGWNRGEQDRYFTSHSGLDRESDEYKNRFARITDHGTTKTRGKDYAYYN